jgi:hypothetical protein
MSLPKDLHPWNTAEQLAQADRVIARETRQRGGILCAWCLGFVPLVGAQPHGMCAACTARFEALAAHAEPLVGGDN